MILFIDNYDSFTYNLVQYFGELTKSLRVIRNDDLTISQIKSIRPSGIVISPGPGRPENAGVSMKVIEHFAGHTPILGVCLGHQAIAQVFGGRIVHARVPMHGKTSEIFHQGHGIFRGLPSPMVVGRYHSLIVQNNSLPSCLEVLALTFDMEIMGIKHKEFDCYGVQFHPESILTPHGKKVVRNFVDVIHRFTHHG